MHQDLTAPFTETCDPSNQNPLADCGPSLVQRLSIINTSITLSGCLKRSCEAWLLAKNSVKMSARNRSNCLRGRHVVGMCGEAGPVREGRRKQTNQTHLWTGQQAGCFLGFFQNNMLAASILTSLSIAPPSPQSREW